VNLIATLALNLVLAFVVLLSLHSACAWGELCGIRPGRDKSGLGGFAAIYLLTGMRWLGVALVLFAVARPAERWPLLAGHLALGWLAIWLFHRGLRLVEHDRFAPLALGVLGGVVLPLPALTLAVARTNFEGPEEPTIALALVTGSLLLLHAACFRNRRADMLRSGAH
jgi:hypothetical protein